MRVMLALGCAVSLLVVAACNRGGEEAPPPDNQADAAENVTAGTAEPIDVAAVIKARHDRYHEMGKAMKGIGDQLKSDAPSVDAVRRHAALIAGYGPQLLTWFPEGSGPESGRDTRAKAEIWTDAATFRERGQAFEAESARFNAIAQAGDVAAVRAAMPALGNACKNCHDRFRGPEREGHEH